MNWRERPRTFRIHKINNLITQWENNHEKFRILIVALFAVMITFIAVSSDACATFIHKLQYSVVVDGTSCYLYNVYDENGKLLNNYT